MSYRQKFVRQKAEDVIDLVLVCKVGKVSYLIMGLFKSVI
ncbi:MAG: hypothetical protein JG782_1794 [Anaerophaga sp.]|nr:hypothetical protein [Anaerophaga sp.]MDN5291332.1 hypothetical protein [Anaerophaga sp.]